LDCCGDDIPARAKALRGLGAALASAGQFDDARAALEAALELERAQPSPDPVRVGRALRLLAAVYLVAGEDERAVDLARDALDQLDGERSPGDAADACRTLGRVLWRQGDYAGALEAFQGEIEFAQSMADRDDARIGMALHHFADAARMTGSLDRAVANYRRALTHKNPATDPGGYWITQLALHRALTEMGRQGNALDITQEMLDHLTARGQPDLAAYGYAQAIRARTQQAMDRPIRAGQSIQEWTRLLAARSAEAVEGPHPGLPTLALGLAVRSLLADNRPALALPLAERSAALTAAAYPDALPAWAAARDLGEVYMALDRLEEAVITLEPLLGDDLRAQPGTFAQAHRLSGDAYRRAGDLETALAHYEQAADVEPDALLKGLTRRAAGEVLLDLGRPGAAVESFGLALELIERAEHPDVAAQLLTLQAQTLGGLNRYAEAIDVYEDALTVLRAVEGVSPEHTADVLHALGQTHEAQGQLPEAARVYRRALNVLERADAPRQIRDILHALARVAAALGEGTAVQLYEQTRDQTREWGDQRELGRVLCELGDVHRDAGRMLPAIQNYQAALEAQAADDLLSDRVNTLRNLGRAYAQMERYDEAREAWTEALDLSKDMPDLSPLETALTYHAIAEAHRSQRNYQKAEIAFREALKHHGPNSVPAAATWRALGQVLHETQRHPEAVETLRRAIEIEKAQPQQANARLVLTLQLLAEAQEARGDLDAAIARHHEALVYMDRRLQPVGYADSLRTLGRLYREHGAHQQAITALNEALEIESGHAPRSDERISETLQAIADTYRDQGELEKAAEYYQKVTVYANMSRRASTELRATLDELERRRATLQAAQQSLALLDRNDEADLKDLAFIYALIARSYANLSQPQECATTIHAMLDALDEHRADLDRDHTETDMRALAWLSIIHQAQDDDDIPAARAACAEALLSVSNANLRWVIEQLARSFEAE